MTFRKTIGRIVQSLTAFPDHTQLAIAVIRNGKTDYFGFLRDKAGVRETDNSSFAFEIGSVTKAFTGYLLAQLVAEKKVTLDQPAQRYLPFPLLNTPPVTLKHLATHTSGLPGLPRNFEEHKEYDKANPYKYYTEALLAAYCTSGLHLDSPPGEKFSYSNLGMSLLGYIISQVEGVSFEDVMVERIFRPLKMKHSSFSIHEVQTEIVKGIDDKGNFCEHWEGGIFNPSLGIISTVEDLSRFAAAICDTSNTAAEVQSAETFPVDHIMKINLGWSERLILPQNIRMQGISGGTGGYGASVLLDRERGNGVVLLSNCWPWHYMEKIYPLGKELLVSLL